MVSGTFSLAETHEQHTAHTANPVPCIVTKKGISLQNGSLADVAPTVLELMGLPKPSAMTGVSLIRTSDAGLDNNRSSGRKR